jgi:hypothetical protein
MAAIMVKIGVNVQGDNTFPKILFMSMFTHIPPVSPRWGGEFQMTGA